MLPFCFLKSQIRDFGASKVSDTLPQHQLPIVMNVWLNEIIIELIGDTGGAALETFQVVSRPPVVEPALSVELRTLIVEAVADFVPHDNADRTIIKGIYRIHVECRRLKDAGGKHNFVKQRVVVGIRGGRSHSPAAAVGRL